MQRLGRDGPPDVLVGGGAEGGEGVADAVGEVERDEEPRGGRGAPAIASAAAAARRRGAIRRSSAQQERSQHVERDRGRAVADVGAAARQPDGALLGVRAAEDTEMQTVPTGFASEPAARAGDAR